MVTGISVSTVSHCATPRGGSSCGASWRISNRRGLQLRGRRPLRGSTATGRWTLRSRCPTRGHFKFNVAWADQGGDELPRLSVFVESETGGSGADGFRAKIVELYDKLLGVQATPHSPDVEARTGSSST